MNMVFIADDTIMNGISNDSFISSITTAHFIRTAGTKGEETSVVTMNPISYVLNTTEAALIDVEPFVAIDEITSTITSTLNVIFYHPKPFQ